MLKIWFQKRSTCLIVAAALTTVVATAQPSNLTGFPFLRIEPSARASALGGSFVAVPGLDASGFFYNPALLEESMAGALSLSYLNHLSDINAGFASFARELPRIGMVGLGLRFIDYGSLQGATATGEKTGAFGAGDVALTVGSSRAYSENIRYGANVHLIYSSVSSFSASAVGADLGVTYSIPASGFTAGASINNLGFALSSLGDERDQLPLDVRLGVSKKLTHLPLLISAMAYNLNEIGGDIGDKSRLDDTLEHFAFGGEFLLGTSLRARIGYNHRRHNELKTKSRLDLAGFGFGIGVSLARFTFDYGRNSWSANGALNQLSVSTRL